MSQDVKVNQTTINCRGKLLDLSRPCIMGILNVTDDSFYPGSRLQDMGQLLAVAERHLEEGAQLLDVGVMSSRPGADEYSEKEEMKRLGTAICALRNRFPDVILSADTYRAEVARVALEEGADIINDIGGGIFDEKIWCVVAEYKAPYVLMHNRAKSHDMKRHASYDNLLLDVLRFFFEQEWKARAAGIVDVILDPGIGFSKTAEHNFQLLNRLHELRIVGKPLLIGLSRKSFIYKTLNGKPEAALNGTTAMHMVALQKGADILRVHDVKEAVECIKLNEAMSTTDQL